MSRFESKWPHPSAALRRLLPLALCLLGAGTAVAQSAERRLSAPPPLPVDKGVPRKGVTLLKSSPAEEERVGREIRYTLPIKYTTGEINNPATGTSDLVKLRSYGDSFVGPTISMKPGQTARITLKNELPALECPGGDINTPKPGCYSRTNLHSHGLWVSPSGNSDNVLLTILPGATFQYEYNVPEDHPAGTFWYHPHSHGSTSIQVASGMAGALIIKGDRLPTSSHHGDIDTLLAPFEFKGEAPSSYSEVVLLQQIPYACFESKDKIRTSNNRWTCNAGEFGVVEDFSQQIGFNGTQGKPNWELSGRYTLLNGKAQPEMHLQAGRIYRFRLIHAGVSESLSLAIRKVKGTSELPRVLSEQKEQEYIQKTCTGDSVSQWEVAADGLTRDRIVKKDINYLQPGYRSDVLVAFPGDGVYCVIDESAAKSATVSAQKEQPGLLAMVVVKGGTPVQVDMQAFITSELLKAADQLPAAVEEGVRKQIKRDLLDGLRTNLFVPHPPITDEEVRGTTPEEVVFNIEGTKFTINDRSYDHSRIDRQLILDTAQEWVLRSKNVNHPFHIHVNPFQIVSIRKKDKTTGKVTEEVDPEKDPNYAQYIGMKGAWKDTLFVQDDVEIRVRTRYERYIGDFVLHCHILDHEDQGMMQNVRITLPDDKGKPMAFGHQH
jgi:L-ascorbate oxidase